MITIFFLIGTIITLVAAISFLSWGIYQIKTGKMVAKRKKKPVDEPRQVGVLFLFVSLACFWIIYANIMNYLTLEIAPIVNLIFAAIEMGFCITAAIYGLVNKRIFGFKNTDELKKYVRKYYTAVNIALLVAMLSLLTIFSSLISPASAIAYVLFIVTILSIILATVLMLKIEREYRK